MQQLEPSTPFVTEYRHSPTGELSEVVYPTGLRLAYDRDPVTREVTSLRNADTGEVYFSGASRVAGGPLKGLTFGNGTTLVHGYNNRWETTSVATGPMTLAYSPTPGGDVGQIVENGLPLPFRYDFLDRLTGSTGWFSFAYDGNGNRTSEWVEGTNLAYTFANDRLKDASTPGSPPVARLAFTYDYQANVSGIGKYNAAGTSVTAAICLRHDPLGRLVLSGATNPGYIAPDGSWCFQDSHITSAVARFKYDHRNRRVASWRSATNEWVYTLFDQGGLPLAELAKPATPTGAWRTVREYVWLGTKPVAQVERDAVGGSPRTYAVHVDAIGMPRALTNPAGTAVWRGNPSRPYGDVLETTTPDPANGRTVVTNLRLPGQYDERLLASVGLQGPYYNWNRWYLPSAGRYLELDPIAKRGGFNRSFTPDWYGYAEGNPLRYQDADGRIPLAIPLICVAGAEVLGNLALIGAGFTLGLGLGDAINRSTDRSNQRDDSIPIPAPPPGGGCPPCPPDPPPETDWDHPHGPCPGVHWHYRKYNQIPSTCECRLGKRQFGGCGAAPGFVP